jgi:hypothetical protein
MYKRFTRLRYHHVKYAFSQILGYKDGQNEQ